jgi:pimeloyl-ACP methyl ester carboxylesterase
MLPADRFEFFGTYVRTRTLKEGLGAPLAMEGRDEDVPETERFAEGRNVYYGATGLLRFEGRNCVLTTEDPLAVENVRFAGHTFPLAADFTAPLALATSQEDLWIFALQRLLRPQKYVNDAKILLLQPYDPSKIPVICLHGLVDSPSTWMPIVNTLRGDADIRKRYQFWFFSYPSGYPYPYIATIMRQQLDLMKQRYPDHKKAVLIGHSMGGSISRTMITDSGMKLWNAYFAQPPEDLAVSSTTRDVLTKALIFKRRPEVGRVIFLAVPHRGSERASAWIVKIASKLVKIPRLLLNIAAETHYLITPDRIAAYPSHMPNSIETLSPNHRFVKAINAIPLASGVPFHSIMGDRGKGGNKDRTKPESNDGYVPYWSSHLDGAESEMIVPSDHSVQHDPQAIEEIRRILQKHGR